MIQANTPEPDNSHQQMRWSPRGARLMLEVSTAVRACKIVGG